MRPVGTALVETTATVRSGVAVARFESAEAPSRSKPRYTSTLPAGALLADASAPREMRRSETTGPPFWDRPVWSSPRTSSPSIRAAMPSTWLTVTTPVPPTPIMRTPHSASLTTGSGSGSDAGGAGASTRATLPGTTVRNDGQSPSTHE